MKIDWLLELFTPDELRAFRKDVEYGRNSAPVRGDIMYTEEQRRIYYQIIVYEVCSQLDKLLGNKPGEGVVCGTVEEPSRDVQLTLQRTLEAMALLLHQRYCWDCKLTFWAKDSITPHCLCPACNSQDTRRVRR